MSWFCDHPNNITLLHKLPPEGNIFSAETQAIPEAITLVKTSQITLSLIINDSFRALLALRNSLSSNDTTQNIKKILKLTNKKKSNLPLFTFTDCN